MSEANPSLSEIERRFRVVDQMSSMHAFLRDRNSFYAGTADTVLLLSSTFLCAMVFADSKWLTIAGLNPELAQLLIGLLSTANFALSIVAIRFDWKQRAEHHAGACLKLHEVKQSCRSILRFEPTPTNDQLKEFCRELDQRLEELPPVPESDFNPLKMRHINKVSLSKMLSDNPGANILWLTMIIKWRAARKLWTEGIKDEVIHK